MINEDPSRGYGDYQPMDWTIIWMVLVFAAVVTLLLLTF